MLRIVSIAQKMDAIYNFSRNRNKKCESTLRKNEVISMSTEKESGAEAVKKAEIKVKAAEAKAETALKTAKKTVKNTVASKKKPAVKKPTVSIEVQFAGKSFTAADLQKRAEEFYRSQKGAAVILKTMELYVKPEEGRVYVVANGEETGSFEI